MEDVHGRAEDLMHRLETRGESYVNELIISRKAEEAFLDFKRSGDNGVGPFLHSDDRTTLSKALSGFANSDGGVIVWGVGSSKKAGADAPEAGFELKDCVGFAARLDDAVSGATIPAVPGVRSVPIPVGGGPKGYVATFVPASAVAPHRMTQEQKYMIRAGSSFSPATHGVLAGMFGRAPHPRLTLNYLTDRVGIDHRINAVSAELHVALANVGSVIASDAFLSWQAIDIGGHANMFSAAAGVAGRWQLDVVTSRIGSVVALPDVRLPPGGIQIAAWFKIIFKQPIDTPLELRLTYGCSGAPPSVVTHRVEVPDLISLLRPDNRDLIVAGDKVTARLFGIADT